MPASSNRTAKSASIGADSRSTRRKDLAETCRRRAASAALTSSSQQGRSEQRQVQATVLASEIASLPDLSGYLVTPREPIRKVTTDFVAMEQVVPAYISKDGEE